MSNYRWYTHKQKKSLSRGTHQSNVRTVQWDATHQSSNPGARTFSWIFQELPALCVKW
jgi:hypothetical protein